MTGAATESGGGGAAAVDRPRFVVRRDGLSMLLPMSFRSLLHAEEEEEEASGSTDSLKSPPPLSTALISGSAAHFIHTLNTRTNER